MADDSGLFGPGTITWRVNGEAVLLAGGGRALLLQVAHPSVAAAVEQHSSYETDPWGRLLRTLDVVTRITFGDAATSARAAAQLRAAHRRVRGVRADGAAYDAGDPDLLLWVWATLLDSAVLVYTRCVRPLSLDDLERYYAEQTRFAAACGVPQGHWPAGYAAFRAYFDAVVDRDLQVTDEATRVGRAVTAPAVPLPVRPAFELLNLLTAGLLPERVREQYGLAWGPHRERLLAASTGSIRRLLPLLPGLLRRLPPARAAERRVAHTG
jgi:uncharacterized protein (DUF2236 family)